MGRWGWVAGQVGVLAGAVVGLVAFGWVSAGLNLYLVVVDPRGGSDPGKPVDLVWVGLVVWLALSLGAAAGLPRSGADGPRWRQVGGVGGAAGVQFVGGLVVIGGTLLAYLITHPYTFGGPDTPCTYASCWPLRPQALALTTPGLAAGLALITTAFLTDRTPWWTRATTPPALWLTLLLLQNTTWTPYLLPLFQTTP